MGHDETSSFGCSFPRKKIENSIERKMISFRWFLSLFCFVCPHHFTLIKWWNESTIDSNNQNVVNVNRKKNGSTDSRHNTHNAHRGSWISKLNKIFFLLKIKRREERDGWRRTTAGERLRLNEVSQGRMYNNDDDDERRHTRHHPICFPPLTSL